MRFSIYKLKISSNSPLVPLLKHFNNRYFPYIYSKSSNYLEGYFFFYGSMDYYFLKQFCIQVESITEDYFSSLRLSYTKKYYTNNISFFNYYFNLSRYDVTLIEYPFF